MRYNSDTERGINIDEIAAQCRAALDTRVPEVAGFKDYANGLLGALQSLDRSRFKGCR